MKFPRYIFVTNSGYREPLSGGGDKYKGWNVNSRETCLPWKVKQICCVEKTQFPTRMDGCESFQHTTAARAVIVTDYVNSNAF